MSSSSVEQCALCANSMHDVHHAIVEVNVVIGVLVVHCELLVVRVVPVVVCYDAVVRRTLVLIAFTVPFVFVVAILRRILLYWRYGVYKGQTWSKSHTLRALRRKHVRDGKLSCEEGFEKSNAANTQSDRSKKEEAVPVKTKIRRERDKTRQPHCRERICIRIPLWCGASTSFPSVKR